MKKCRLLTERGNTMRPPDKWEAVTLMAKLQLCIDSAVFIHETSDDDFSGIEAHRLEKWLKEIQLELLEKKTLDKSEPIG